MIPHWTQLAPYEWSLLIAAAAGIGLSKSGFAGVSMLHVIAFAFVFGAKASTGILLPLLVIGDCCAIVVYGKTVQWRQVQRLLPPTLIGVGLGSLWMEKLDDATFKPLVGGIILTLTLLQIVRLWRPRLFEHIPHKRWFAWSLGLLAGITTMVANAAGPIVALYLVAISLSKFELVGTSAWFFLVINVFKLPFSYSLGLIQAETLLLDATLAPAILLGMMFGKWLIQRVSQRVFDSLLLLFTAVAALRLIGLF